jgi:hypothetical protein
VITYSVWNPGSRLYDYFATSEEHPIHAPSPKRTSTRPLGATPEEAAWKLPPMAHRIGSGAMPQGRIASLNGADEATGSSMPTWWPVAAVGIAMLLWRSRR